MNDVVIVSAVPTPIGKLRGALAPVRPDDLAAHVIRAAVDRAGVPPEWIEEVFFGCANQAGEDNRNVARMGALLAGLPPQVAGVTLNRLCASGLSAINQAARAIRCGEAEVLVAGGVESMTRAPYSLAKNPQPFGPSGNVTAWDKSLGWRYPNPRMEKLFPLESMGETAENTLPLTAPGAVDVIITDLAVFDFAGADGGLRLIELMAEATLDEVHAKTSARFEVTLGARASSPATQSGRAGDPRSQ